MLDIGSWTQFITHEQLNSEKYSTELQEHGVQILSEKLRCSVPVKFIL